MRTQILEEEVKLKQKHAKAYEHKLLQILYEDKTANFKNVGYVEQQLERLPKINEFVTLGDLRTGRIDPQRTQNTHRVLGYDLNEFTMEKLYEIIHPDDLTIAMEYALIVMRMMREKSIKFDDTNGYSVEFPVLKDGNSMRLERYCQLYNVYEGIPHKHIDVWTDRTQYNRYSNHVQWSFHAPTSEQSDILSKMFYEKWTEEVLGFQLAPFLQEVLALLRNPVYSRVEIADVLQKKQATVTGYIYEAKKKVNDYIEDVGHDPKFKGGNLLRKNLYKIISQEKEIKSEKQLLDFMKKYSLFTPIRQLEVI